MKDLIEQFDFKKAAKLAEVSPQTLRVNTEKDVLQVYRATVEHGGAEVSSPYGQYRLVVSGARSKLLGQVRMEIDLVAVHSAGYVAVEE